jgi:hypothetical protein
MAKLSRNFTAGKMNKMVDDRLIPNGEYIDALNVRMGSTEDAEIGVIENTKGNERLTTLQYNGEELSDNARCIGAFEDSANETLYWFIHDSSFGIGATSKLDLIVSYNTITKTITYHVISIDDGDGTNTTLNFDANYLITGVDLVENLLFFTDNINAPRKINITKSYNPTALVDDFTAEELLVIKKPPVAAPQITFSNTTEEITYLEERFICFAYRYRYEDNEYSATSEWSDVAFDPKEFRVSYDTFLNEGLVNEYNAVNITYNTGGPLVKGIDLLFKNADDSVIKVIEKIDKEKSNIPDNIERGYTFTESSIFTILPESEILRLFDNVPRLAKAQTIMGNRLMYGNYVEGYDLLDSNDEKVRIDYFTNQVNTSFGATLITATTASSQYFFGGTRTVANSAISFDLSGQELKEGKVLSFVFNFAHQGWTPASTVNPNTSKSFPFIFTLPKDYVNVVALVNSTEFINAIGTVTTIQPASTASSGTTLTDRYNALWDNPIVTPSLPNYNLTGSAIEQPTAPPYTIPIEVTAPSNDTIKFRFNSLRYENASSAGTYIYEDFSCTSAEVGVSETSSGKSLHSNRGYEIGMAYLDEYGRSTPPQVSENNTEFIGCDKSSTANSITVNIPTTQKAPYWAKRYKFFIKPDSETYETIYSNIWFVDPNNADQAYFLLRGENAQKITDGQRLIVKADTDGATNSCLYVTVLEKKAQEANFIEIPISPGSTEFIPIPSGVYMLLNTSSFSATQEDDAVIDPGVQKDTAKKQNEYPVVGIETRIEDPSNPGNYIDYTVPEGSQIIFDFKFDRPGNIEVLSGCEQRTYTLQKSFISTETYNSFYDWFVGDNIKSYLNSGTQFVGGNNPQPIDNQFLGQRNGTEPDTGSERETVNYYEFTNSINGDNLQWFSIKGTKSCFQAGLAASRQSSVEARITVIRSDEVIVFESFPLDAAPDIWYEASSSYEIVDKDNVCQFDIAVDASTTVGGSASDIVIEYTDINSQAATVNIGVGSSATVVGVCGTASISTQTTPDDPADVVITSTSIPKGSHLGDTQNQTATQPAICKTGFFNCFTFGNGVESYKIRDSILGKTFNLGNRVSSTEALDYKEIRRFADITYSGTFNDESNVNRLNEFNRGLLNFKPLEESFGQIQLLSARKTDILTLQEDKISYVLQGKNLLSDASAGNLLTSVPEVLGQQIARIEEFGISNNPESFAQWGPDKYFTDSKRGVVLVLSGSSASNESLNVVSALGMRPWFRDLFLDSGETQKLGGFDPYMNEYVLSSTQTLTPTDEVCIDCNNAQTITLKTEFTKCFDLGESIGDATFSWEVNLFVGQTIDITVTYNGVDYTQTGVTGNGSIVFDKSVISNPKASLRISTTETDEIPIEISMGCPQPKQLNVVTVCVSNGVQQGLRIHNQYRYVSGTYIDELQSRFVTLDPITTAEPAISDYNITLGNEGQAGIPSEGSTVTIAYNKFQADTLSFDETDNNFRYLVSSTQYVNTPGSITSLLAAATTLTTDTSQSPDYYSGSFTMPSFNSGEYLYLIYDYRQPTDVELCYGATQDAACCDCADTCGPTGYNGTYSLGGAGFVDLDSAVPDAFPNDYDNQGFTSAWYEDVNLTNEITNTSVYSPTDTNSIVYLKGTLNGCSTTVYLTIIP